MESRLGIIIPFYKLTYFEETFLRLCSYNNKLKIYIGNDSSISSPEDIIYKHGVGKNIIYKIYDERLGHICPAKHWNRCVNMVSDEEWLWILPDDDLPSQNCVAEFYRALEDGKLENVNVVRIPLNVIDRHGHIIKKSSSNPLYENNYEFYSRLLHGQTESSLGDNIFRRSALEKAGGFVDFPRGWGSDHATVLKAASGGLIYCMQNASFGFRMSGENISSDRTDGAEKMAARVLFAKWLKANENIFPQKPDLDFYRRFYWKGEYYALHEWDFSPKLFEQLLRLRHVCTGSSNPLPLAKLFFRKMLFP